MGENWTPSRAEIDATCRALTGRHGPFGVHDAVLRALAASGWDPAGDGAPTDHDLGIAEIIGVNVDVETDFARCIQFIEGRCRGHQVPSLEPYRPVARAILQHFVEDAAHAV